MERRKSPCFIFFPRPHHHHHYDHHHYHYHPVTTNIQQQQQQPPPTTNHQQLPYTSFNIYIISFFFFYNKRLTIDVNNKTLSIRITGELIATLKRMFNFKYLKEKSKLLFIIAVHLISINYKNIPHPLLTRLFFFSFYFLGIEITLSRQLSFDRATV